METIQEMAHGPPKFGGTFVVAFQPGEGEPEDADSPFHELPLKVVLGSMSLSGRGLSDLASRGSGSCLSMLGGLLSLRLRGLTHGLKGLGSLENLLPWGLGRSTAP